jgi:hypothetical protein
MEEGRNPFAHFKHMNLDRLPSRGRDQVHLAAIAQNLRKQAKLKPLPAV